MTIATISTMSDLAPDSPDAVLGMNLIVRMTAFSGTVRQTNSHKIATPHT
jgi:hypothetical protein